MMGYTRFNVQVIDNYNVDKFSESEFHPFVYSNSKIFLTREISGSTDQLSYSYDARLWTRCSIQKTLSYSQISVVNDKFFICDPSNNVILVTDDGIEFTDVTPSWLQEEYNNRYSIDSIRYGLDTYYIYLVKNEYEYKIYSSSDLVNWVEKEIKSGGHTLFNIATGYGCVYTITSLLKPESLTYSLQVEGEYNCIITFASLTVDVTEIPDVYLSRYGTKLVLSMTYYERSGNDTIVRKGTWYFDLSAKTSRKLNTEQFRNIQYHKNLFVCIRSDKYIATSSDGITWTNRLTKSYFYSIIYKDGVFIAAEFDGSGVWYSTNGTSWVQSNIKTGECRNLTYLNDVITVSDIYNGKNYTTRITSLTQTFNSLTAPPVNINAGSSVFSMIPQGGIPTGKIYEIEYPNSSDKYITAEYIPGTSGTSATAKPFVIKAMASGRYISPSATVNPSITFSFECGYYVEKYSTAKSSRNLSMTITNCAIDKRLRITVQGTSSTVASEFWDCIIGKTEITINGEKKTDINFGNNTITYSTGRTTGSYPYISSRCYYDINIFIEDGDTWRLLYTKNSYNNCSTSSGWVYDSISATWNGTYEDVMFHSS